MDPWAFIKSITEGKNMNFNFLVSPEFSSGIVRLAPTLGYTFGCDITVSAETASRPGVSLVGNKATIYYNKKHQFFRELGILVERLRAGDGDFSVTEDGYFERVSAMLDASRCAVPTVGTMKSLIDRFALMGYGMLMLYTEDTVELEGYPYFGHLRGRYTHSEIREIDDYAFDYGIELVPCIECYGHMERYLIWPAASKIRDTSSVLMAREPTTFEFLDKLIGTVSSLFRSRRIHLGLDEAHDMGRGKFFDKHGYVPAFELFNEYMADLMKIVNSYGLSPMMWSDMYFRVHSASRQDYYDRSTVIPESTKKLIPENMELVFWYYGETSEEDCDDYMLKKHLDLGREVSFAGGAWSWAGLFPEHNYMMLTNRRSLEACRKNGVNKAMLTVWCNDNAECDYFANLPALSFFAELCYNPDLTESELRARFEATTGGDYDLFYRLCYFHNDFERTLDFSHRDKRFLGKQIYWQDVLQGLYDRALWDKPMSEHYAYAAKCFEGEHSGEWAYLYGFAYAVMDYLRIKFYVAERLVKIYKSGDKAALREMATLYLPELIEKCDRVHRSHKAVWHRSNKPLGWQNFDVRYGGIKERCKTAIEYIEDYLSGKLSTIEELDQERLPLNYNAYVTYQRSSTVNYR